MRKTTRESENEEDGKRARGEKKRKSDVFMGMRERYDFGGEGGNLGATPTLKEGVGVFNEREGVTGDIYPRRLCPPWDPCMHREDERGREARGKRAMDREKGHVLMASTCGTN